MWFRRCRSRGRHAEKDFGSNGSDGGYLCHFIRIRINYDRWQN
ncbi:MAG: hypothetical protein R3C26_19890 [Calditrichia bacterium]